MEKEIEIPEDYEARIEGNKVILELKESEDERIRKWLIKMVEELRKANPTNAEHNGNCSEAIAYLEKQKEQKPTNIDYISKIRDELLGIENNAKNIDGLTASQWVAIRAAHRLLGEYLNNKQKPAEWSEKDKVMLNNIIWSVHMKSIIKPLDEMDDRSRYKKYEDFLKALPERFDLQPHWKPSDEQMKALEDAFRKDGGNEYRKVINSLYCDLQKLL